MKIKYFIYFLILACATACSTEQKEQVEEQKKDELATPFKLDASTSYKFHVKNEGKTARIGDFISFRFTMISEKGDTLTSSHKHYGLKAMERPLEKPSDHDDLEKIFSLVTVGDSLTVSLQAGKHFSAITTEMPKNLLPQSQIKYLIKITGIKTIEQRSVEQIPVDDRLLMTYFTKNKLTKKILKADNGLYLDIEKAGTGNLLLQGDSVRYRYTTSDLQGHIIDTSDKNIDGLMLGKYTLIPAWDFAFKNILKKGSKVTLYIPSNLGFGGISKEIRNSSSGVYVKLYPFTLLKTEIEIVEVIEALRLTNAK